MSSEDDLDAAAAEAATHVGGWVLLVLFFIFFVVTVITSANEAQCAKTKCTHGNPRLVEGECLCVERPSENTND